ncbi:MAG: TnpV protein [Roseburia intestinalis]
MCETINHLLCGWCNKFVIQKNHLSAKIELFRLLFNERKGDFNGKSNKFYGTYKMDVQVSHCICNDIFNHTSLCEFHQGKLLLHLTIPFEEKPKTNLPSDNLRYYRQRKQMTTRQLAEKLNIVPATIVMYENGKHPIPYAVSIKLADVLEIEASLLYDDFSRFLAVPYTEALKSVRTALGLSQKAFAEQIGIVPSYYYIELKKAIGRPSRKVYQKNMCCTRSDWSTNFTFMGATITMKVKEKMIGGVTMAQNLTYTRCGDYLIPDIQLSHTSDKPLGKYGRMRRAFLAENNPMLLDDMILTETLFLHLWEIDEIARCRVEQIMAELLEKNPAPDMTTQQLAWAQHMNSLKAQAEEMVNAELIFC